MSQYTTSKKIFVKFFVDNNIVILNSSLIVDTDEYLMVNKVNSISNQEF